MSLGKFSDFSFVWEIRVATLLVGTLRGAQEGGGSRFQEKWSLGVLRVVLLILHGSQKVVAS